MSFHGFTAPFSLALNNIPLSEKYNSLSIHSPTEGHLVGFRVLTITNKAAVNSPVQVSAWT